MNDALRSARGHAQNRRPGARASNNGWTKSS